MEFIGIPIAMVMMYFALALERRVGATAAGWFAALPVAFGVASATIAITNGPMDASTLALSASGHLAPMACYACAFVWVSSRHGAVIGLLAGIAVYALTSLFLVPVPAVARVLLGVVFIVFGHVIMRRIALDPQANRGGTRLQLALQLTAAGLVVALIALANRALGPDVAGAVGAFPITTTTMTMFIAHRSGVPGANAVMKGLVRSLPIYLSYCLVFALLVIVIGTWMAALTALATALLVGALTWRRVDRVVIG